jgi:nickel-dependent lactate racemase
MKKTFKVTYGTSHKEFELDDALLSREPIAPRSGGEKLDKSQLKDKIRAAVQSPTGRPPLRQMARGRKVGLVVSDEFRAGLQREIIEVCLEEIAAGKPASITVLCATGTHDPAIYARNVKVWVEEKAAALGAAVEFVANDCDRSDFVDLGTSPRGSRALINRRLLMSDLRVYGHESKHHYMAGYSSIDKQIVPGVSARKTVEDNHIRSLSPDSGPGRHPWHPDESRRENPFSCDAKDMREITERRLIDEKGALVEREVDSFVLDMISDKSSIFWISAGSADAVCSRMPVMADEEAMFVVKPEKYVIVSPGGPPASQALYGVQNCFDMALKGAIRQGGEALIIAPCNGRPDLPEDVRGLAPDKKSKDLFWDNLVRMRDWEFDRIRDTIEKNFELYLLKTFRVLRLFKIDRLSLHVHCELPASTLEQGGFHAAPDIQAWIDERAARSDGKFTVIDNGNKLFVMGKD